MKRLKFQALVPRQSKGTQVACFLATVDEISAIARIDRLAIDQDGVANGFQRTQIASHIREIGDYLVRDDALLANPIVLGFVENASITKNRAGVREFAVDARQGPPGVIVDGQQRFTALTEVNRPDFQVPVSAFICRSQEELHRQFILINNTRPLPKALVYELLPGVRNLPKRLDSRGDASAIALELNRQKGSALKGMIQSQTNPRGVIKGTIVMKLAMNSLSDGALRMFRGDNKALETRGVELISEFFHAVRHVFHDAWENHSPRTSRLLHGTGISAMGFVMEYIHAATGAVRREQFIGPLSGLRRDTAWTDGEWVFGTERRRWNGLQNVSTDRKILAFHLVRSVQAALHPKERGHHVRG